jgi:hypothetical protein
MAAFGIEAASSRPDLLAKARYPECAPDHSKRDLNFLQLPDINPSTKASRQVRKFFWGQSEKR